MIDHEDIDRLTEAFVSGFDPVHQSNPQWGDAGTWWPTVPTSDEAAAYAALMGEWDSEGAPLNPPPDLEPSDEDWDEWAAYAAAFDGPDDRLECEYTEVGARVR